MMRTMLILSCLLFVISCVNEPVYSPKPRLYPKVNYPEKEYQSFKLNSCGFEFEYPKYADIKKDNYFFDQIPPNPCWFDLEIPELNCSMHFSYLNVKNKKHFEELVSDSYKMVAEHNIKASFRDELKVQKPNGVSGIIFEMEGEVASPLQFFLTDSTNHFLRASLYFNNKVRPDSVRPIYEFVKKDVSKIIETFSWQ